MGGRGVERGGRAEALPSVRSGGSRPANGSCTVAGMGGGRKPMDAGRQSQREGRVSVRTADASAPAQPDQSNTLDLKK